MYGLEVGGSLGAVRVEPLEARFAEFDYHTFLGIYADNFCGGPASAEAEADAYALPPPL